MTDSCPNQNTEAVLPIANSPVNESGLLWLHGIFFWLALSVIGLSFLLQSRGPASVYLPGSNQALPELCTAKRVFGVPCPGCGLTRSFISISHGQFDRAWAFNPAGFLLYPFVAVQIPWNAMQYWLIRKRGYGAHLPLIHFLPIAIATVLLVQWLLRMQF